MIYITSVSESLCIFVFSSGLLFFFLFGMGEDERERERERVILGFLDMNFGWGQRMIVCGLGKEVGDERMKSDEDFKRQING